MSLPISVLYISYTGLLDPLGQSQVLQYVLGLARQHRMTLLTFERPAALCQHNQLAAIREQCITAGVDWHYLTYHNRPNLPATAYDTAMGVRQGIKLARAANARIVHCRSYIAGLMGLAVSRATGAKHIFDMRGFWPDERVDGGIWHRASAKYRVFKRLERSLFLNTDHVVSLTQAAAIEIEQFPYLGSRCPPISVIPTCTNLGLFRPPDTTPTQARTRGFTLGYVGSTGSWYLFDEVALAVSALFERYLDAQFVVVNQEDHDYIRHRLLHAGVDLSRVTIVAAEFSSVPKQIARMDAGIFFIKPTWSKRASCPTRFWQWASRVSPIAG